MGSDLSRMPDKYIRWSYRGRRDLIHRIAAGEDLPKEAVFLGFSRHTPTVISTGSAGLNGSVKGVGFVPSHPHIEALLKKFQEHIDSGWSEDYSARGLEILEETIYGPSGEEMIDFTKLATLELAKGHTWQNLRENRSASLVFYEPPVISFELRAVVEIHEEGLYHEFVNAQHDVYHKPNRPGWSNRPAYLFNIQEIYDNSATNEGFGKLVFRREAVDLKGA